MDLRTHIIFAIALGFGVWWVLDQLTLGVFSAPGAGGVFIGAVLPDIVEPAVHWTHRGKFHSVKALKTTGIIILCSFVLLWISAIFSWVFFGAIGYASHLLLDSTTKMGLPKE
jgi:membrane-bound metal-dependent hydrolase YbcI (DUF457 family)